MNNIININNLDGTLTVSSREVANNFSKQHSKIIRSIENLIENEPSQNWLRYFIENSYKDGKGEIRKEYLLTRDGFSLLVMGFTGAKALEWKLKYIEAFNMMEQEIKEQYKIIEEYKTKSTSAGEVASLLKSLTTIMKDQKSAPNEVAEMAQMVCMQFSIMLPKSFIKKEVKSRNTYDIDSDIVDRRNREQMLMFNEHNSY